MKKILLFLFLIPVFAAAQKTTGGNYTYIAQRYEWLTGIFQALGLPAGDSAQHKTGQDMRQGAVYLDTVNTQASPAGFYIYKNGIWELQADEDICQNRFIDPITVTYTGTGMRFFVSGGRYQIGCNFYYLDSATITLANGESNPRFDAIILTTSGVDTLKGVESANPSKPMVSSDQIELTFVGIAAAATTPTITTNIIYDENTGESTVTNTGTTTDPDNTSNVYRGTKSLNVTNIGNNDAIYFDLTTPVDLLTRDGLSFFIDLKAVMLTAQNIGVQLYNGSTAITNEVNVTLNKSSTSYQGVSIARSSFTLSGSISEVTRIRLRWRHPNSSVIHAGFHLDYYHFIEGIQQPPTASTPLTIGAINGVAKSANGGVISNDKLHMQTADGTFPGLLSPTLYTKLNNQRWEYFIRNLGSLGDSIAVAVNDSTVGIKKFRVIGATAINTDTTFGVDVSALGVPDLQQVTNEGNITTTDITVGNTEQTPLATLFNLDNAGAVSLRATDSSFYSYLRQAALSAPQYFWLPAGSGSDTLATLADVRAGGGGYTDADARAAISLTTTGTSGAATYNDITGVLNVPNYSGGATTWSGVIGGTTATSSAVSITCGGSVQWIFTGSSPVTWTLPAFGSCGNRAFFFKNEGSADVTVQRAGSDQLYTDAAVNSITLAPGENSLVISGVTYWHVHSGGGSGRANTALSNLASVAINTSLIPGTNNAYDIGSTSLAWKDIYSHKIVLGNTTPTGTTTPLYINSGATYGTNTPGSSGNLKWRLYDDGGSSKYGIGMSSGLMEYQTAPTGTFHVFYVGGAEKIRIGDNGLAIKGATSGTITLAAPATAGTNTITFPASTGTVGLLGTVQTWTANNTWTGGLSSFSGTLLNSAGGIQARAGFYMDGAAPNGNLSIPSSLGISNTVGDADYDLEGSTTTNYRVAFSGTTSTTLVTNSSFASMLLARMPLTEGGGGNHPLLSVLALKAPTITGGVSTVSNTATLYIEDAPSATVSGANYALWVKSGNVEFTNGNLTLGTAGNKINIATGSNASAGTGTFSGGTVTINTTAVTANSLIQVTHTSCTNCGSPYIGTVTAGTSFVVNSSNASDASTFNWIIIN